MKKRWIVMAVVTTAGLVLLAGQFVRRSSVRPNTGGATVEAPNQPVAAPAQELSAASNVASESVDVSAEKAPASSGMIGAVPPVQKSIPVRAEPATALERQLASALAGVEAETDPMRREERIKVAMDELAGSDFGHALGAEGSGRGGQLGVRIPGNGDEGNGDGQSGLHLDRPGCGIF